MVEDKLNSNNKQSSSPVKTTAAKPKPLKKIERAYTEKKLLPDSYYCRKCQKGYKSKIHFYEATNTFLDQSGYMSICKYCCMEIYDNNVISYKDLNRAIYETCKMLDWAYNIEAAEMTIKQITKWEAKGKETDNVDFLGVYKSKLHTMSSLNNFHHGLTFFDSDKFVTSVEGVVLDEEIEEQTPQERLKELISRWGKGLDAWEYDYLEEEMSRLLSSFECPDYGMEMIMKDISMLNLSITKQRQDNKSEPIELIKARSQLMEKAKMNPIQSTGADANDAVTFGTLIKKIEDTKPIPKFMDSDMRKYIDTFMVGQLAKMEGINNEYTEKLDNELAEYSIDLEVLSDEHDNLVEEENKSK